MSVYRKSGEREEYSEVIRAPEHPRANDPNAHRARADLTNDLTQVLHVTSGALPRPREDRRRGQIRGLIRGANVPGGPLEVRIVSYTEHICAPPKGEMAGCTCYLEPTFTVAPSSLHPVGEGPPFTVMDAECVPLCETGSEQYAYLIAWALNRAVCADSLTACPVHPDGPSFEMKDHG